MNRCRVLARRSLRMLVAAGLCGAAGPSGLEAQERAGTRPLELDRIFRDGGARQVAASPEGRRLAVTGEGPEGAGIYLVELGGPAAPPLPGSDGTGARRTPVENGRPSAARPPRFLVRGSSADWSPDGARLAFLREGDLWVASVDRPAGARPIARDHPGLRAPAWSPDGRTLAFFSAESGFQDIWLVDAEGGGEPRRLTSEAMEADDTRFGLSWSPDGRRIAYVSNAADWWHDDVWVVDVRSGRARRASERLMASSTPVWSPDGTRLALMGTAKDGYWYQDLADIWVLELGPGPDAPAGPAAVAERTVEMQVWASDFIMRFDPFWSEDGRTLHFPYHERGAFDLWAVSAAGGVATRVTSLGGLWLSLDASADGRTIAFVREGPAEGTEAWVVGAAGGPARRVTRFASRFEGVQVPVEISFRSWDGLYIQGFLYLPPAVREGMEASGIGNAGGALAGGALAGGALAGPPDPASAGPPDPASAGSYDGPACPALIQVHGGGTNAYYQGRNLIEQYLASRGFVVLAINYRGGSGFGRAFQELAVEDWLNGQAKDPGAATDWLRARPWVNGKVGIYGGSYGGMQSMAAITRTPEKFDAAVPMRGIYSLTLTLPYQDRVGKIFTVTGHGGRPGERPEIYEKTETLARMDRITAPVLVMHGEEDVRAPFRNFELAVERLEALGKTYEAKTYPEGHGFRDPANLADMYGRLEGWFRRWLGACEPGGAERTGSVEAGGRGR